MNKIILTLCVVALFNCCNVCKQKKSNLKVQVKIIEKLNNAEFKGREGTFYSLKINLINNTDSIIRFWSMNCSWEDTWIAKTNTLRLFNRGCDRNFPEIMQIGPRKKITYNGIAHVIYTTGVPKETDFWLGFIFIKEDEVLKELDFNKVLDYKIENKKDIVWSEHFKIDK